MPESIYSGYSQLTELQVKAADLRIAKFKAEKEFIDVMGKDVSPEEKAALAKKRREILYQLEVEGAQIEKEFVEKYRSKLAGFVVRHPGLGIDVATGCPFCTTCITSCLECVTSCTHCIGCTNDVF